MSQSISFPRDEQAHDATIEWWYWNGHLYDANGNRYSFTNCLFRADATKSGIPFLKNLPLKLHVPHAYFAHAILTDITEQKTIKDAQHVVVLSRDSFTKPLLHVSYHDPLSLHDAPTIMEETAPFSYRLTSKHLDLALVSQKPPLLEAGTGYISVAGRESYYYSLTDIRVAGTIAIGGKKIAVNGKAWMDHQWADVAYARDKWSWFSLQLNDGTDLMCVEYDTGEVRARLVDTIHANGTTEHGTEFMLDPGKENWKSPRTQAVYPLAWDITIPTSDIRLSVRAPVPDQELLLLGMNYWEGPVNVVGAVANKPITGVGFMELVGYPGDYTLTTAIANEIRKQVGKILR